MATVNFSVPEDVKDASNHIYSGQNKSAVITKLMREAVERVARKQKPRQAITNSLLRPTNTGSVAAENNRAAYEDCR